MLKLMVIFIMIFVIVFVMICMGVCLMCFCSGRFCNRSTNASNFSLNSVFVSDFFVCGVLFFVLF